MKPNGVIFFASGGASSEAPHQPGGRFWLRRLASLGCRYFPDISGKYRHIGCADFPIYIVSVLRTDTQPYKIRLFTVHAGRKRLNLFRDKHRRRKVEKSCVTFLLYDPGWYDAHSVAVPENGHEGCAAAEGRQEGM